MDRQLAIWIISLLVCCGAAAQEAENSLRSGSNSTDASATEDAEAAPTGGNRQLLTKDEVAARIERLEQVPEEIRPQVADLLKQALAAATEIDNQSSKAEEWRQGIVEFADVEQLRANLATSPEQLLREYSESYDGDNDPIEELEDLATEWADKLAELRAEITRWDTIPEQRRVRKSAIPRQITDLNAARETELGKVDQLAAAGALGELDSARRILAEQRVAQYDATIKALEDEEQYYEAAKAAPDKKTWAAKRLAAGEQALKKLRQTITNRSRSKAESNDSEADKMIRDPEIAGVESLLVIAQKNKSYTEATLKLVESAKDVAEQTLADQRREDELERDLKSVQAQFEQNRGISQIGGRLLRDRRSRLPSLPALVRQIARRQAEQNEVQFHLYSLADLRRQLDDDNDQQLPTILAGISQAEKEIARRRLPTLLSRQRIYLNELIAEYEGYNEKLGKLIASKEALRTTTQLFADYIAERDLWIRSCQPLGMGGSGETAAAESVDPLWRDTKLAIDAAVWSIDPNNWLQVGRDLTATVARRPVVATLMGIVFVALLIVQRRARAELLELGTTAANSSTVEFYPSVRATWLTIVVSLPWPLLMWAIGWLLDTPFVENEFTRALAAGLRFTSYLLLLSEVLRQSARSGGLATAHFGWPSSCTLQVRRFLRLVPTLLLPIVLWITGLEVQTTQSLWSASLGRVLFIAAMILVAVALWRMLLSAGSPLLQVIRRQPRGLLMSIHRVWRPLLVVLPIVLACLAVAGYYYTAQQLAIRVLETSGLVVCLMLISGLSQRWVLLSRRKLAREQARQRRAAAAAAAEAAATAGESPPQAVVEAADESVDLAAISDQTRKLINTSLQIIGLIAALLIWQDVFPALARLDASPLPVFAGQFSENPMTWGQLLRFLLAVVLTVAAVRDIPSLLELSILQHIPMDQGARYAISALVRYAVLAVGGIIAARTIGINSASIGWLVAAVSVGLGFGLQEIFANFVSGIILLFERPIRVGDIITLGDKTGVVSRIRIRATTIVDWDRKEYIVPNKDLVTERLLNWTLTDQTNRIVIPIGVAYGSDTELAIQLLREVAEEHPLILDDPGPLTTFEGFGDSTLNLILRCYLPNLDHRLQTIHELHTAIDQKYREHNIEIAFPQQDVHLRSLPPGLAGGAPIANGPDAAAAAAASTAAQDSARPAPEKSSEE